MSRRPRTALFLCLLAGALAGTGATAAAAPGAAGAPPTGGIGSAPLSVGGSDWPQNGADAAQSHANLGENRLPPSALASLVEVSAIGVPRRADSYCANTYREPESVTLAGNRVYGAWAGTFASFEAQTGRRIWRVGPDAQPGSQFVSLAVTGALVVAGENGCQSGSATGYVTAVHKDSGVPAWRTATTAGVDYAVVSGGTVIATEYDGRLTEAFDLADGHLLWRRSLSSCANQFGSAVVAGGLVIVSGCTGPTPRPVIQALTLRGGRLRWTVPGAWSVDLADSTGPGARVYATLGSGVYDERVYELDAATGAVLDHLPVGVTGVLAATPDAAYCTTRRGLLAYDVHSKRQIWRRSPYGNRGRFGLGRFLYADGVLYDSLGSAFDASTGAFLDGPGGRPLVLAVGDGRIAGIYVGGPRKLRIFEPE